MFLAKLTRSKGRVSRFFEEYRIDSFGITTMISIFLLISLLFRYYYYVYWHCMQFNSIAITGSITPSIHQSIHEASNDSISQSMNP